MPSGVHLTWEQAREMQDLLIAAYGAEDFQRRLHALFFITGDDKLAYIKKRQELCLEVQGPIITKFGFEANRKGVALSVQAFSQPDLVGDPELQAYNVQLRLLVNPEMQDGFVNAEPSPPQAPEAPSAPQAPHAPQTPQAPQVPQTYKPKPRAFQRNVTKERPPDQKFLTRFKLGPPGGFTVQAVQLTVETAIPMLDELIAGFSSGEFQKTLRKTLASCGDNQAMSRAKRQDICMKVQIPIVSKYGFEPSFDGVLMSARAFTPELNGVPEIQQKNALVFWLIDPLAQAHTPVPSGPARVALYSVVRCKDDKGRKLCELNMDISGGGKSVKENVQLKTGAPWIAQRVWAGEHEIEDHVSLSYFTHVGGSLDVVITQRDPLVVEWLQKMLEKGRNADCLAEVPRELLGNAEFMIPACRHAVRALEYAPAHFRSNRKIMLDLLRHSGQALQYVDPRLQNDLELVMAAVAQDGWALQWASEGMRSNRDVVLRAVHEDGWALQFAPLHLRGDREIVLKAASKDAWVLANASPELQKDWEVVYTAVKQDWKVLEHVSPQLRADREIMLVAVRQSGWALEYATQEQQGDWQLVYEAVTRTGEALRFAAAHLTKDREICITAVRRCGVSLAIVDPSIQDIEMVLEAIKQDARAMQFVDKRLHDEVKKKLNLPNIPAFSQHQRPFGGSSGPQPGEKQRFVLGALQKAFQTLGISESAAPEEIKKTYKRLALKHHPDKHPDNPEQAKQTFQSINDAFSQIKEALGM